MQFTWAQFYKQDKTPFVLVIVFVIASLTVGVTPKSLPLYGLVNSLVDMSLIFLLIFLLAVHRRGKRHIDAFWKPILAVSAAIWIASFWLGSSLVYNNRAMLSWQLFLVASWLFGYYNIEVTRWWHKIKRPMRRNLLLVTTAAVLLSFGLYFWLNAHTLRYIAFLLYNYTYLSPVLLLVFCGWISVFYHGCRYIVLRLTH